MQDPSEHYGANWPPDENDPMYPPPTPSHDYYKYASDYFEDEGNYEAADLYMDTYEEYTGKSIGQTVGTGEDEYDSSYVDIPKDIRPSAPANLWAQVYAGLQPDPTNNNQQQILCQELCGKMVKVDKKSKREPSTNKRPPMCHVIAFNHIRWAVEWLYTNKSHAWVNGNYKGPNALGFTADTWKSLVWDVVNLRPGHAKCNSTTASQAKGAPKTSQEQTIVKYVVGKLKVLEPLWF